MDGALGLLTVVRVAGTATEAGATAVVVVDGATVAITAKEGLLRRLLNQPA